MSAEIELDELPHGSASASHAQDVPQDVGVVLKSLFNQPGSANASNIQDEAQEVRVIPTLAPLTVMIPDSKNLFQFYIDTLSPRLSADSSAVMYNGKDQDLVDPETGPSKDVIELIIRFSQLTRKDKTVAVRKLLQVLTPHEYRTAVINAKRQLYLDILPSLPFELLANVVKFLDPADVVAFQRVCRQWKATFSHPELYRNLLLTQLGVHKFELGPFAEAPARFGRSAQRHHAMRNGRPFQFQKVRMPKTYYKSAAFQFRQSGMACHSGKLAVMERSADATAVDMSRIHLVDLQSGKSTILTQFHHEGAAVSVQMSKLIIAVLTEDGFCSIFDVIDGSTKQKLELPQHHRPFNRVVVEGDRAAMCCANGNVVLLWNARQPTRMTKYQVEKDSKPFSWIMLHPSKDVFSTVTWTSFIEDHTFKRQVLVTTFDLADGTDSPRVTAEATFVPEHGQVYVDAEAHHQTCFKNTVREISMFGAFRLDRGGFEGIDQILVDYNFLDNVVRLRVLPVKDCKRYTNDYPANLDILYVPGCPEVLLCASIYAPAMTVWDLGKDGDAAFQAPPASTTMGANPAFPGMFSDMNVQRTRQTLGDGELVVTYNQYDRDVLNVWSFSASVVLRSPDSKYNATEAAARNVRLDGRKAFAASYVPPTEQRPSIMDPKDHDYSGESKRRDKFLLDYQIARDPPGFYRYAPPS